MSAFYDSYEHVESKEAFLSGYIGAICDDTLAFVLPRFSAIESDVFRAEPSNICEKVKTRLKQYLAASCSNDYSDEKIDRLNFELQEINESFSEYFKGRIDPYIVANRDSHNPQEKQLIDRFFADVKFQLGDCKKLYRIKTDSIYPRNFEILSEFYTYIVFEVIFIEYENYMVMIVFGSDE